MDEVLVEVALSGILVLFALDLMHDSNSRSDMPEDTETLPAEGAIVTLDETEATAEARSHGDRFEVVETRFRRRNRWEGYTYSVDVTPEGEDGPTFTVDLDDIAEIDP